MSFLFHLLDSHGLASNNPILAPVDVDNNNYIASLVELLPESDMRCSNWNAPFGTDD